MKQSYFSTDYSSSRQRFNAAVAAAQGALHRLPLQSSGDDGEPLGIDIAWFGNCRPRCALIHVCGIHGVEGFAGSAVQLATIDALPALPPDGALILVHGLNPYGMANLRRANENNVDLNRNFFFGTNGWQGAPAGYATLDRFLNPPYPPTRVSSFHVRLLLAELSLGGASIRQAVAGGQYDFPKGIFYGGKALEEGPRCYGEWLAGHLQGIEELFVIDLHTGLGKFGQQSLFIRSDIDAQGLARALGLPVTTETREAEVMGYEHEGGHCSLYRQLLPGTRTICVTQEFGTYNGRRLLRALRAENQHHHYGGGRRDHASKRKLKAMFCPEDERWRSLVVTQGGDLIQRAAQLLSSGSIRQLSTQP